jgi:hypothetical protein
MRNTIILSFFLLVLPFSGKAQLGFLVSFEGGVAGSTVKSDELPVFLTSYNAYFASAGLSKPFEMKQGLATGKYFNFMVGMGGEITKMTLGFGRYVVSTPHNEARFTNGVGRDIWTEIKDASTEVGIRSDFKKLTIGFQFVLSLRTVSIYSQRVYADDSRSIGNENVMNGVYEDFTFGPGLGANIGYRVLPHLYIVAKADYVFRVGKSHPEYHQFDDLQDFRNSQNYLPRDVTEYYVNPYNGSNNSISNDIRGLRFGLGIQLYFSTFDLE